MDEIFEYLDTFVVIRNRWSFTQGKLERRGLRGRAAGEGRTAPGRLEGTHPGRAAPGAQGAATATSRSRPKGTRWRSTPRTGTGSWPGSPSRARTRAGACASPTSSSPPPGRGSTCCPCSWSPWAARPRSWPGNCTGATAIRTISCSTAWPRNSPRPTPSACTPPSAGNWASTATTPPQLRQLFNQGYQGSRYSFGYPACPDLEGNATLLELLGGAAIGVTISEQFQMDPEYTTSALVAWHPQARYFAIYRDDLNNEPKTSDEWQETSKLISDSLTNPSTCDERSRIVQIRLHIDGGKIHRSQAGRSAAAEAIFPNPPPLWSSGARTGARTHICLLRDQNVYPQDRHLAI